MVITPRISQNAGVLAKENLVVRNSADPDKFNHLMIHLFHPQKHDPARPVVIMIPGMLCNANLFRVHRRARDFRDLDSPLSFANALAFEGYSVVLPHPRYARWVYTRYVKEKLGVPNHFSESVDLERLVDDLAFYLDAALGLCQAQRAAVLGFSMGGMELLNYLAYREIDPRLCGNIFLGTPVEFKQNTETLISMLRIYGKLANYVPVKGYGALSLLNNNLITIKNLIKFALPQTSAKTLKVILELLPVLSEVFDIDASDPESIIAVLFYVLERLPEETVEDLITMVAHGYLIKTDTEEQVITHLPSDLPPSLILRGSNDRLVSAESDLQLSAALGKSPKRSVTVEGAGHVDSVTGLQSEAVLNEVLSFLANLPSAGT